MEGKGQCWRDEMAQCKVNTVLSGELSVAPSTHAQTSVTSAKGQRHLVHVNGPSPQVDILTYIV